MPATGASFLDLMAVHAALDEQFLRHQEALIALDVPAALARLWGYEAELLAHMRDEEDRLLPIYRDRAGRVPGGPLELFLGEHAKMRGFLEDFRGALARMRHEPPATLRRSVIALMDRQAMYKHLVEHHDLRERNILYPKLDEVTTAEERGALLGPPRAPGTP